MKRIMILPLALLLTVAAYGQRVVNRKTVTIGPVIGFGHSWMSPVKYSEFNPSFSAGGFAIYSPVEHWGVGIDARYSIEGAKKTIPETGEIDIQYDYLRVPIRAMYFFGSWKDDFRPKITAGPSMGFLLKQKGPGYTTENKFDIGLTASGGFNYRIHDGTWLNFDAGWYHGFSDVIQHTPRVEKHRNMMVNLGIGFEI